MICWQGGSVKYEINTLSCTSTLALSSSIARPYFCHSATRQNRSFSSINLYISTIVCRGSLLVGIKILSDTLLSSDLTAHFSDLLKYSNFSGRASKESPILVFLTASLSAIRLSLRSLMQWLIRAHFKHGYSPLISTHTLPIPLSPIAALIMRHLLGDPPPPTHLPPPLPLLPHPPERTAAVNNNRNVCKICS